MEISARNQLQGKVTRVILGTVTAEVTIRVGRNSLVAVITKESAQRLGLKVGGNATALIKSTDVMVMK